MQGGLVMAWGGVALWGALALGACQVSGLGANQAGAGGPPASSVAPSAGAPQASVEAPAFQAPSPSASSYPPAQDLSRLPQGQLRLGPGSWQVALAEETEAQTHGLSGQAGLEAGRGLLFLWSRPRSLRIWMPEMNFPIDVLFFQAGELKAIFPKAQPCPSRLECPAFGPEEACDAVLEIGAGEAERLGVKVGQRYELTR